MADVFPGPVTCLSCDLVSLLNHVLAKVNLAYTNFYTLTDY